FRVNTGVNFIIDQAVLDSGADVAFKLKMSQIPAKQGLDLLCELSTFEIGYVVRDGVVRIVPKDQAKGGGVIEVYDVPDLTSKIASFPSTDFDLSPSGAVKEEPKNEETAIPLVIEGDPLKELITNNIEPKSWSGNPNVAITLQASGALVVRQTPEVHKKIAR